MPCMTEEGIAAFPEEIPRAIDQAFHNGRRNCGGPDLRVGNDIEGCQRIGKEGNWIRNRPRTQAGHKEKTRRQGLHRKRTGGSDEASKVPSDQGTSE